MSRREGVGAQGPEPVIQAFHRVLDLLEAERIPACVMGGFAFQVHGIPRATFDVDVQVAAEPERVRRLLERSRAEARSSTTCS